MNADQLNKQLAGQRREYPIRAERLLCRAQRSAVWAVHEVLY